MDFFVWQRTCVDDAGNVIASASVTVTDVVSGALAQLYSDPAGSVGIGNPITADSEGFVQFYVKSGFYNITATSGSRSRTWTREAIGAPHPRTAAEISAGVTPVDYRYPEGNVLRYGTNTTPGTTDMKTAIQNAINVAEVAKGRVFIPEGRYYLSAQVTVDADDVVVEGAGWGTVLETDANDRVIQVTNCANVIIRNLCVKGDANAATNTNQQGVSFIGVTNGLIENVRAEDISHDGIQVLGGNNRCTVSNCVSINAGDDGINVGGTSGSPTNDTKVIGCTVIGAANDGIHVSIDSARTAVVGNTIVDCTFGIGLNQCSLVSIVGNTIQNSTTGGINTPFAVSDPSYITISGNTITGGTNGIRVSQGTNWTITGNQFYNIGANGIIFTFGDQVRVDAVISGNAFIGGCSTAAINCRGVTHVNIADNNISDVDLDGVLIRGNNSTNACEFVSITGNVIYSPGNDGIEIEGDGLTTHVVVSQNIIDAPVVGIRYSGGAYFSICENIVRQASGGHGIAVTTASSINGRGRVAGNIVEGAGATTSGIRIRNYLDVLVHGNFVYDITGIIGIEVDGTSNAVIEGNFTDGTVGAGERGILTVNTPSGNTAGTITNKLAVYDKSGTLVGYLAIYDDVTAS